MDNTKRVFSFIKNHLIHQPPVNAAVFAILRTLKTRNPGDTYYDQYLIHYEKRKNTFIDVYHLMWLIGTYLKPQRVMEIGCRTGISICQLLAPYIKRLPEQIVLFDVFNDGFLSPGLVKTNLRHLGLPTDNVKFVIGDSLKTVPAYKKNVDNRFDDRFDYILVDGCHDKGPARQDLENVVEMLAPSGILLFDDIAPDGCSLLDVWEAFKAAHNEEFYFVENMNGKGVGVGVKRDDR